MTGAAVAGALLIQQGQFARGLIDGKGANRAIGRTVETGTFPDGVQEAMVGMDGQETGIRCFRRDFWESELATGGIQAA